MSNDAKTTSEFNTSGSRSAAELIDLVRGQVSSTGKKLSGEAAAEVAPLVNLLAVAFPKEENDEIALASLAVIALAARKGSKDAKKRIPKIARWAGNSPPSLGILTSDEERRAAIEVFATSRPAWLARYALNEAVRESCDKQLVGDLVKSAYKAVDNSAQLLDGLVALPVHILASNPARLRSILVHVTKAFLTARVVAGGRFPESYQRLAEWLAELSRSAQSKTMANEYQTFGVVIGEIATATEPALLFDATVHSAFRSLRELTGEWGKAAQKRVPALSRRMLSVVLLDAKLRGLAGSSDTRSLLRAMESVLPIAKVAKTFKDEPLLSQILSSSEVAVQEGMKSSGAVMQEQLASVLVAWDSAKSTLQPDVNTEEFDDALNTLAQSMSVVRAGRPGDVMPYDPLQQHLVDPTCEIPQHIRITNAGVHYIRPDGTHRVLIKALVTPM